MVVNRVKKCVDSDMNWYLMYYGPRCLQTIYLENVDLYYNFSVWQCIENVKEQNNNKQGSKEDRKCLS